MTQCAESFNCLMRICLISQPNRTNLWKKNVQGTFVSVSCGATVFVQRLSTQNRHRIDTVPGAVHGNKDLNIHKNTEMYTAIIIIEVSYAGSPDIHWYNPTFCFLTLVESFGSFLMNLSHSLHHAGSLFVVPAPVITHCWAQGLKKNKPKPKTQSDGNAPIETMFKW